MPIRRNPASGSGSVRARSETTRPMMWPTVRQDRLSSSATALMLISPTSQATLSSRPRVKAEPWRAQGTRATTTPCSGQQTRGAPARRYSGVRPRSSARQRRGPPPGS